MSQPHTSKKHRSRSQSPVSEVDPSGRRPTLFIVESPIKARTIAGFLGDDYVVRSTKGHIADISSRADAVDVDNDFAVSYELHEQGRMAIDALVQELSSCGRVVLATDADREGELIAQLVLEFLEPSVPVERITFHAVTEGAIREALQHPRPIDPNLVAAARTRRILDRLFGYEVTDVMRRKVRHDTTAGRVQSPALRLVVDREYERMAFRSATYFDVAATIDGLPPAILKSIDGTPIATGSSFDSLGRQVKDVVRIDESEATSLVRGLSTGIVALEVVDIEHATRSVTPPTPFILSTLVQEAASRLAIGTKEIESLSNDLFHRGHITYVRTDNPVHYPTSRAEIRQVVASRFGDEFVEPSERSTRTNRKSVQGAHEAIRPTRLDVEEPIGLTGKQLDLYRLIWQRTLASQMTDARRRTTTLTLLGIIDGRRCEFRTSGSVHTDLGFHRVYPSNSQDVHIPDLSVGERVPVISADVVSHKTKPPARYSEGSLIRALEELGIGRPSTYTTIIRKLREGYVWSRRGDRSLIPTLTAFAAHRVLSTFFVDLISNEFTNELEERLDDVALGSVPGHQVLRDFYVGTVPDRRGLVSLIEAVNDELDPRDLHALSLGRDPESGDELVVRAGKADKMGPRPYLKFRGLNVPLSDRMDLDDLQLDVILNVLPVPRILGLDPVTDQEITLNMGRHGPYVERDGKRASVARLAIVPTLTVTDARTLIEEKLKRDADRSATGREPSARRSRRRT